MIKKWYGNLFFHFENLALVAAWRLHKHLGGRLAQLEFRRQVTCTLLRCSTPRPKPGPGHRPVSDVRFDDLGHHILRGEKEGRCKLCKKNTCLYCNKCNVRLDMHCEKEYHKK